MEAAEECPGEYIFTPLRAWKNCGDKKPPPSRAISRNVVRPPGLTPPVEMPTHERHRAAVSPTTGPTLARWSPALTSGPTIGSYSAWPFQPSGP